MQGRPSGAGGFPGMPTGVPGAFGRSAFPNGPQGMSGPALGAPLPPAMDTEEQLEEKVGRRDRLLWLHGWSVYPDHSIVALRSKQGLKKDPPEPKQSYLHGC